MVVEALNFFLVEQSHLLVARERFKRSFIPHKASETRHNQKYLAPNRGALGCCTHAQTQALVARDRFKYRSKISALKRNFAFFVENSREMGLEHGFMVVERFLGFWEAWALKLAAKTWFNGNRRFLHKKNIGVKPVLV